MCVQQGYKMSWVRDMLHFSLSFNFYENKAEVFKGFPTLRENIRPSLVNIYIEHLLWSWQEKQILREN